MKDQFTKEWIITNSLPILERYEQGVLTLRALHYQLVGIGMTNDTAHYKRVGNAMVEARWNKIVDFEAFSDLDRVMIGKTAFEKTYLEEEIDTAKRQIDLWMKSYKTNRWENQHYYPEVFIEKKALQGVFQGVCKKYDIALGACKGYPSLTFLYEASLRFKEAEEWGKQPVIIYFGDYDPSGEDIPRSLQENLSRMGVEVEVRRIALMEEQVRKWRLPHAPAKETDTRTANWEGIGQVELDAVKPEDLMVLLEDAIQDVFDEEKHDELIEQEMRERKIYIKELKEFVNNKHEK